MKIFSLSQKHTSGEKNLTKDLYFHYKMLFFALALMAILVGFIVAMLLPKSTVSKPISNLPSFTISSETYA